jgi:hypothetical protein
MVHPLQPHFDRVIVMLRPLRAVFENNGTVSPQRKFFDEYLDANELELALDTVCDFILESPTPMADTSVLARIEDAFRAMELQDDRLGKVRSKICDFQ